MRKIDEIYKYMNANAEFKKETIIARVAEKYKVAPETAQTYYYKWKKVYTKSSNCVPRRCSEAVNDDLKIKEGTIIKGKYGVYIKDENKLIVGDVIFRTEEDIEKYRTSEIALFYARLSEIMDVMKLEV